MRFIGQIAERGGLCALLLTIACEDVGGLMVEGRGTAPSADARVLDQRGSDVTLAFLGQPLQLTLDASHSSDPDGRIVGYRWLAWSGSQAMTGGGLDGGTAVSWMRTHGDGGSASWSADVAQPTVRLGEGSYVFTLWVVDDRGNASKPATVRVRVEAKVDATATAQCVASAADMADPRCVECLCGVSQACREAVSLSKCDDTCWGLLECIGARCPDVQSRMTCVPTSCAAFLPPMAPMAALDGARALGDMGANCFSRCGEACQ